MRYLCNAIALIVIGVLLIQPTGVSAYPVGPDDPTQAVDPIDVVRNYIATANTGDFEKTFAFYAEDAIVKNAVGLYVGRKAIGDWLRQDVQTTRATPQEFQVVNGNTVINTGTVSIARFEQLGLGQTQYRAEYIIENGKIRFFSPMPILTPEQQEKLRATSAGGVGAGAPADLPRTGTAASYDVWLGGLALLLIAIGLGLIARRRMLRM